MLKSMTAYGNASVHVPLGHFVIEISSVNRKFLEINFHLPSSLDRFEYQLKKLIATFVTRGQITVKVTATFEDIIPVEVKINIPLARQLCQMWDKLRQELHIEESVLTAMLLSQRDQLFCFEDNQQEDDHYLQVLQDAVTSAMQDFVRMRNREGIALQEDIIERLQIIDKQLALIEQKAVGATNRYYQKLLNRLKDLAHVEIENEERVLREVAIFAEKIDIAEEITRAKCHLTHFKELMQSSESAIGKTLEFILQELNREITTISNKSSDLYIARATIEIKSEFERIREQVQNVE